MNFKMNPNFIITFLLVFTLFGCKNPNTFSDYKYSNKPKTITCDGVNPKLYNEALYSFEEDILNYYKKTNPKSTLVNAYSQFIRTSIYGKLKYEDIISEHTLKVFEALKDESNLWDAGNPRSYLNYSGSVLKCVSDNIEDQPLKTTFNALLSTNSMSPKLFGTPLLSKYRLALKDKHLATYIALDLFYAKLFKLDFSKATFDKQEQKVDFNKTPEAPKSNTHAGHNN
ncbi:hypothetical protein VOI54_08255 [Tamlana sp. 2201CG12-4]|uniref:hypothetical protein n=1 Tax=Tamlana sp. 2201CG12-4 TaxID=3112582 RepID=UPI002DBAA5F3|nr:hypothetical protein [Tamlana sp. 2201CG12-4]MEC3907010.1 hypothetical protein [Tamlana sp. 2201CG12-4]